MVICAPVTFVELYALLICCKGSMLRKTITEREDRGHLHSISAPSIFDVYDFRNRRDHKCEDKGRLAFVSAQMFCKRSSGGINIFRYGRVAFFNSSIRY